MNWKLASSAKGPVGRPDGDIEDACTPAFLDHMRAGVAHAALAGSAFVIDLAAVGHIAVSGLFAMTLARKEALEQGTSIILAHPQRGLREVLEISRYQLIFDIVDELEMDG